MSVSTHILAAEVSPCIYASQANKNMTSSQYRKTKLHFQLHLYGRKSSAKFPLTLNLLAFDLYVHVFTRLRVRD